MSQFVHIQYSHFHILVPPIFPTIHPIIHLNVPTISLRPPSNTPPVDAPLAVHLLPSPNDTCVMCFPHVRRNDRPVRGTRCVPRKPHTHTPTHTYAHTSSSALPPLLLALSPTATTRLCIYTWAHPASESRLHEG